MDQCTGLTRPKHLREGYSGQAGSPLTTEPPLWKIIAKGLFCLTDWFRCRLFLWFGTFESS